MPVPQTITVTTDVNIVSTKFNYKTVAAIIQSIQCGVLVEMAIAVFVAAPCSSLKAPPPIYRHSTQYFQPPYAKIMMQIRTKSQYPYMFNKDTSTVNLHVCICVRVLKNKYSVYLVPKCVRVDCTST